MGFLLDVATELTGALLEKAGGETVKRWLPDDRRKALTACLEGGLRSAEALFPADTSALTKHYGKEIEAFIKSDDVATQLQFLLKPASINEAHTTELTKTLRDAFVKITKHQPEKIPDFPPFGDFVIALVTGFYSTAIQQPALQNEIQISLQSGTFRNIEVLIALQKNLIEHVQQLKSPTIIDHQPNALPAPEWALLMDGVQKLIAAVQEQKQLPAGSPRTVPMQIPPPTEKFTGRTAMVATVREWLLPGRVVTLWGPGGRGKTALSWKVLSELQADGELLRRFPDGVIFHSYYGRPETEKALTHIAQSLVPGIDVRQPTSACQQALSSKRVLLVLDGAEAADDLRPVLDMRGECGVLVTTRNQAQVTQLQYTLPVDAFDTDEAVALMQAWGGRYAEDEAAVRKICAAVGNLPLAVRLAGVLMAQNREAAATYLEWIEEDVIDALTTDEQKRSRNVQRLLARSVDEVSDDAQTVLTLLCQLAYLPVGMHVVQGALEWKRGQSQRAAQQLVDYGLVTRDDSGLLAVSHALIYRFVQDNADETTNALLQGVANYYTQFAKVESMKGNLGYESLNRERGHFMAILLRLQAQRQWQHMNELVWTIAGHGSYLDVAGYWIDRRDVLTLGIDAAINLGQREDENSHMMHLGTTYVELGEIEKAIEYYEQSLAICQEIGDRKGEGNRLGNLGVAYRYLGDVEKSINYFKQALVISREIGNLGSQGSHLGNLGVAFFSLGQPENAICFYEQALTISRKVEDRRSEGNHLGNLGNAYRYLGEAEKAITFHVQALAISHEIGDRSGVAHRLGNIGNAYLNLENAEKAISFYDEALVISREIGDQRSEAAGLGNLGLAYRNLGELGKAISHYEEALKLSRDMGDRRSEGAILGNLGMAFEQLEDVGKARAYWVEALAIFEAIKSPTADRVRKWLADLPEG